MDNNRKLTFYETQTLTVVNSKGRLKHIPVPFQVKCVKKIGIINVNTLVYVESVTEHHQFKIMYRVLSQWIPYSNFIIVMKI